MSLLSPAPRSTPILLVLFAASTLGCGSAGESVSPSAPASPATSSSSGQEGSRANSSSKVSGVISGLIPGCPNASFMVGGTRVVTDSNTEFEGIACTALRNGLQIEVQGVPRGDGVLVAREVEPEDEAENEPEDDDDARVEGTISGRQGTCPGISFNVAGQAVAANASTRFKDASCSMFVNNTQVRVKGVRQTSGAILARELELRKSDGRG
jgi:hypothetical protein